MKASKAVRTIQEATDWAIDCGYGFHSTVEAIDWAINEYQFNLDDEDMDPADRKSIKRTIKALETIKSYIKED